MKVALDARMIDHSGIGTAIEGWLQGMSELDGADRPGLVLIGGADRLKGWAALLEAEIVSFDAPVYSIREQLAFPQPNDRWDLLHVPHYNFPLRYQDPLVVSVHDLFHIKYGGFMKKTYQAFFLKRLGRRDCPIVSVSEYGRRCLVETAGIDSGRVTVVSNAVSRYLTPLKNRNALNRFLEKHNLPAPYLLWNGIDQPHKNLDGLLSVLAGLYGENKIRVPFVLSGLAEPGRHRAAARVRELGLSERVRVIPRLGREEMPALFAGAMGLVAPSLEEGFGLVPLEAMALGVPVAASNRPAIPEICGNSALMFDPDDHGTMGNAIVRLATDKGLRQALIQKGRRQAKRFSWRDSASKLIRVYRQAFAIAP